jgi:hypothetical protein
MTMTREELKQMIVDYFMAKPSSSAKPLIASGDTMGAGVRGQIAGLICVLRDNKTLVVTGGTNSDVHLSVKG